MSLFKWIISQHAVLYTCTVKTSHQNLCSCLCEKTIPLWITYYIMLKVKGYIFSQRQVPVAQTTEKWTHKFKSLLIKPIIIRAQRGYINHGTLYYTNLTHTHIHPSIHTYILMHLLHWLFWLDTAQWKHIIVTWYFWCISGESDDTV